MHKPKENNYHHKIKKSLGLDPQITQILDCGFNKNG